MTIPSLAKGFAAVWQPIIALAPAYASITHMLAYGGCMAEENEGQDTGAEASGAGVDPAAVAA